MPETTSIVLHDPRDPSTVRIVAQAIRAYRSKIILCPSQDVLLSLLAAPAENPTDVVILGAQGALSETLSLLSEIKNICGQTEVILLSPFDDEVLWFWMESIQRGAYEFLPKPVNPVDLMRAIRGAAEKRHPLRLIRFPPAKSIQTATRARAAAR